MSDPESLSRDELVALARRQDAQITAMAGQLAQLMEKFEQQAAELDRLRHLASRNSGNSSMPPSGDDGPGRTPPRKERRARPSGRTKGKQPGAGGTALRWREPEELGRRLDRFPSAHCGSCGAPYPAGAGWPRLCPVCGAVAYRNPLPVAVALLPVTDPGGTSLVVITRTIEPRRGGIALPGGFIDHREDWRHALVRELREETGIEAAQDDVGLADTLSSPDGHLLVFGLLPERPADRLPASAPTDETTGWHLLRAPVELAFPLHTEAVRNWFAGRYDTVPRG